jgi:hypothetical protein
MPDDLGDTDELSREELEAQIAKQLPDREVMSLISPDPASDAFADAVPPPADEAPEGSEDESKPSPPRL